MDIKPGSLAHVRNYFGYKSLADFKADWDALSKSEQDQIKQGLADGSLTY